MIRKNSTQLARSPFLVHGTRVRPAMGRLLVGNRPMLQQATVRHLVYGRGWPDSFGRIVVPAPKRQLVQQTLTSAAQNLRIEQWNTSSDFVRCHGPAWSINKAVLHGGRQQDVDVITVDNGVLKFTVVPTRGMSLKKVRVREGNESVPLGWKSPVHETVHPKHVDLEQFGGLGWLTGFNEWLVRCGVAFAGHPAKDGEELLTLHGRIGNIPASEVEVIVDGEAPHRIRVRGRVDECMFKFCDFQLWTEVSTVPGSEEITIKDTLKNLSDYKREYQMIYHTNFGPGSDAAPLLEEGASFIAPVQEVAPFNDHAAERMDTWQTYAGPTRGYGETVYCVKPHGDESGRTLVALVNKAANRGVSLRYDTERLPVFNLWKNTDTLREGYVTGLEPGTNFAYPRVIERAAGRVPQLEPDESVTFQLNWRVLRDAGAVEATKKEIAALTKTEKVHRTPVFYDPYKRSDPRDPKHALQRILQEMKEQGLVNTADPLEDFVNR